MAGDTGGCGTVAWVSAALLSPVALRALNWAERFLSGFYFPHRLAGRCPLVRVLAWGWVGGEFRGKGKSPGSWLEAGALVLFAGWQFCCVVVVVAGQAGFSWVALTVIQWKSCLRPLLC